MRTIIVRDNMRIPLGKQGENNAVRVVWPKIAEKYAKLYGDGRFELVVVQQGKAYPAVVSVDSTDLVWDVLAADVATAEVGSLELIYYAGDTIAKSQTWETMVIASKSADGMTEPPEDPAKSWFAGMQSQIGDIRKLETDSKDNLVSAINEVKEDIVQSDWNQNDPSAKDYVKNRTHWAQVETQNLPEQKLEKTFLDLLPLVLQTVGAPISITIDGTTYSGVTKSVKAFDGTTLVYFGNLYLDNNAGEDTGESFLLEGTAVGTFCVLLVDAKKYPDSLPTVSGSWQSLVYHKLSKQFLPTTIEVEDGSGEIPKRYTPTGVMLFQIPKDIRPEPVYFDGTTLCVEQRDIVFEKYQEIRVPFEYSSLGTNQWIDYTFEDATLAKTLQFALPSQTVYTAVRLMDPTLKYSYCLVYQMSTAGVVHSSRTMIASGFSSWYTEKFPVCVQIKTVGDTITVSVKGLK